MVKKGGSTLNKKPRFNTKETFLKYINDEQKEELMGRDDITHYVFIGSKDNGKSWLAIMYQYYCLERDPKANGIGLRKYKGSAIKRLSDDLNKQQMAIRRDFTLPYEYMKWNNNWKRETDKKNPLMCQKIEFGSFEDINSLSGITCSDGGYFATCIIEEPQLKNESIDKVPSRAKLKSDLKIIEDTLVRSRRDYMKGKPKHPPIKLKYFHLMNNWSPTFPMSVGMEEIFPEAKWFKWITGFTKEELLGNEDFVNENWKEIVGNLITHYFHYTITKNYRPLGIRDVAWIRMTKFANPDIRNDEELTIEILDDIRHSLIIDDKTELARLLGTQAVSDEMDPYAYSVPNLPNTIKENTVQLADELMKTHSLIRVNVAWDVDPGYEIVKTVALEFGYPVRDGSNDILYHIDNKVIILPQEKIRGHIKAMGGEKTIPTSQIRQFKNIIYEKTLESLQKYRCAKEKLVFIDDNFGGYNDDVSAKFEEYHPNINVAITSCASIKTVKHFTIDQRIGYMERAIRENVIIFDAINIELFAFMNGVIREPNGKGRLDKKAPFKKLSNNFTSLEYSLYVFLNSLNEIVYNNNLID